MAKVPSKKLSDKNSGQDQALQGRVDEYISKPGKYEITEDATFRIEFILKQKDKRWIVANVTDKDSDSVVHWVEFRMWTFDEDIELRKKATAYNRTERMHFVDHDVLNHLKLQRLMKAWSFDKDNSRLKLLHVNGVLSDESYEAFSKLYPTICRYIIEKMNGVLEFNG